MVFLFHCYCVPLALYGPARKSKSTPLVYLVGTVRLCVTQLKPKLPPQLLGEEGEN